MKNVILLGGGGHAKCVLEVVSLAKVLAPYGIVDVADKAGNTLLGVKIVGVDADLPKFRKKGVRFCFISLGSVRTPELRVKLWKKALAAGFEFPNIIHPDAMVSRSANLGRGNYVGPGAIINPGAVIGDHCIINSGAIIEHDCAVGDFAHIASGAVLGGGVKIGARAHVGSGAAIRQLLNVGPDSVIGMGAVVICDVPKGVTVVGNPAKRIK